MKTFAFDLATYQKDTRFAGAPFSALLDSEAGRNIIAAAFSTVIPTLDVISPARHFLRVRTIGPGELYRVAKDPRLAATVTSGGGCAVRTQGRFVVPSFLELDAGASLDWSATEADFVAQAEGVLRTLVNQESNLLWKLLDCASRLRNELTVYNHAVIEAYAAVRYQVEQHGLPATRLWVSRRDPAFMQPEGDRWVPRIAANLEGYFDPCHQDEMIELGYLGALFGLQVRCVPEGFEDPIPPSVFFVTAEEEYLGELTVSHQPTALAQATNPPSFRLSEMVALTVPNPMTVARGERI